jgi:arginine utilization protein RocB
MSKRVKQSRGSTLLMANRDRVNKPYAFSVLPEMTLLTREGIISPQS